MEEILTQIIDKLDKLGNGQQELNERLGKLETEVTEIKEDNKQIKLAVLEINEIVSRIEDKQNEHQKVMEELAYKTALHDNELKRIK